MENLDLVITLVVVLNSAIIGGTVANSSRAVGALEAGGANEVVQPEFEASLGVVRQVLRWLGVAVLEARTVVVDERHAHYDHEPLGTVSPRREQRRWHRLHAGAAPVEIIPSDPKQPTSSSENVILLPDISL